MIKSFQNLISGHWQEILLVLIPILLIRMVRYFLHKRKMNKKLREEKALAVRLMQDEALNDEILNPARKEGDVEEKKYPYKVNYVENGRTRRGGRDRTFAETVETGEEASFSRENMARETPFQKQDFSGTDVSGKELASGKEFYENDLSEIDIFGKNADGRSSREKPLDRPFSEAQAGNAAGLKTQIRRPGQEPAGVFLKVEEYSGFSVKSYMYRQQEVMRVGNRFGKTDIIAGDTGGSTLYFEIGCREGAFYVRSFGNAPVTIQRGRQSKMLGQAAVVLKNGDRIKVEDRVYVVSFVQ